MSVQIDLNTRREISYLQATTYYPLYTFVLLVELFGSKVLFYNQHALSS